MIKREVKTNLLNHSEAKVRLLGEYLKRYLTIICNDGYTKRIKIYDLFCGEGLYQDGGEGSPLVILRQLKDVYYTNHARGIPIPKIDCHFNDVEKTKVEKVKSAVKNKSLHYSEFGDISYGDQDYQKEYESLINILPNLKKKNEKAFIFIDPYEYKHIKINQIKNLMAHGNAEVLLWLPTQQMYRFSNNGTPEALKDLIEEIVTFQEWRQSGHVWDFVSQLKSGFQAALGNGYFVDNFTIQKEVNTVFCLFFFSSHIKGFEKMLEAKWKIDNEEGKGWDYTGNQPSLFHAQKTNPLEQKLKDFLRDGKRSNGDIYEFTLRQGFLPKHTNEVLCNLQGTDKIDVIQADGQKARNKSFYIAYNHYKYNNKKVSINLK